MRKPWDILTIAISIAGLVLTSNVEAQIYIFTSLDVAGSTDTRAQGINDSGEIVGLYEDIYNIIHGFIYNGGVYTAYPDVGVLITAVKGNNNAGKVVGYSFDNIVPLVGFYDDGSTVSTLTVPGAV